MIGHNNPNCLLVYYGGIPLFWLLYFKNNLFDVNIHGWKKMANVTAVTIIRAKKKDFKMETFKNWQIEKIMEAFLFSDDDSFKNNHFDVKIPGW